MKTRIALLAAALLLLAAQTTGTAMSTRLPDPAPAGQAALFALDDGGMLDPVATYARGTFSPPPMAGDTSAPHDAAAVARFQKIYFGIGKQYHIFFGGRDRGVAEVETAQENSAHLVGAPKLPLGGHILALAADRMGGSPNGSRRAATPQERASLSSLAQDALRANGVAAALARGIGVENLTILALRGGVTTAVGSFRLTGSGARRVDHRVFLIAERRGTGPFASVLANYRRVAVSDPLLAEADEFLVDAVSVKADGDMQIVSREVGVDAYTYHVYARAGGRYERVYSGGGIAV